MFNLYFGFGALVLIAFFYVNLAWALMSAHTPPPGMLGEETAPQPVIFQKPEQKVPAIAATLRAPQLSEPAVHSTR